MKLLSAVKVRHIINASINACYALVALMMVEIMVMVSYKWKFCQPRD